MKIGVTERGDAGLDFSWVNKLYDANIIITKHLHPENVQLIDNLVKNKNKIILHMTCTGYGGTVIEPNVKPPEEIKKGFEKLIKAGFPVNQVVLRVDPIIPTEKGLQAVESVLEMFKDLRIIRVRYSIIDMYPHARERFLKEVGKVPFEGFQAPQSLIDNVAKYIESKVNLGYIFETCAENLPNKLGCISHKDLNILGMESDDEPIGYQRKGCLCLAGKTELLTIKKQCPSKCIYCYWRND